ncbi:hypothetical protein SAMN02745751_03213 [Dethiosulfatibacter aminovorans DSM 17477]|uniref:Dolichyl-phosphate-mannose-protein mannosyltransferase n=1 Tax=Dethiosulfatibacter aminovorans DSM 17477 TaxID=1121476 RepID=A0A1M6LMA7_9FIRM|nr:hypothetical protein [Dethiosulfatibacter aminovorans]SHJ72295.1 hypothetical protein SAMN02745751_03213 [Dethiosulfatibacter aminovorans DSM 17477]
MFFYFTINILLLITLTLTFESISILIVGMMGMLLVTYVVNKTNLKFEIVLSIIYLIAIIMMLVAYCGYDYQYGAPYFSGGSDDLAFEEMSTYVMDEGYLMPYKYAQDPKLRYHNSKGFLWIISWIMRVVESFGGYHTIAFRVLNINFLIALGVLTTSYFKENYGFSDHKNLIVLIVSILFPNAIYISVHVFRDTLIIFLLFSVFYIWDRLLQKENISFVSGLKTFFITGLIAYISYWIRNQSLVFIIAIILVSIFLKKHRLNIRNFGMYMLLLLVALIIADLFNVFDLIVAFNERYTIHKLELSDGLSNEIFKIPLFPFGFVVRFAYGLVSPIPVPIIKTPKMLTDIKLFFDVLVSFGTVMQIFLLPYLVKNILRIDKVFILFITFMLGIVVTTFTFRHFIMLYPFMWILIFREFFSTNENDRKLIFMATALSICFAAIIYILIK